MRMSSWFKKWRVTGWPKYFVTSCTKVQFDVTICSPYNCSILLPW